MFWLQSLRGNLISKKTGEYFLYGEGGALTEYARSVCGGSTGGSRIIPLTEEGAKNWAMDHLECDEYEALFGEVEEWNLMENVRFDYLEIFQQSIWEWVTALLFINKV